MLGFLISIRFFETFETLVAYSALGTKLACKEIREKVYGKAIIFDRLHDNYQRAKMMIEMYRNALLQAANTLRGQFPQARIKVIHDYEAPSLAFKSLSTDCFHPSLWGQALLAEVTWAYGFWPDLVSDDEMLNR